MSSAVTAGDDIRFWAGDATPASAEFRVTEAGALTAFSGAIGGFTLAANTLSSGTDADYVALSSAGTNAIWVGDSTFADAEFSVTAAGLLTAVGATIKSAASGARVELTSDGVKLYDASANIGIFDGAGVRIQPTSAASGWDAKYMYGWINTYAGLRYYRDSTPTPDNDLLQVMTQGRNVYLAFNDGSDGTYRGGWVFHYDTTGSDSLGMWADITSGVSQIGLALNPITKIYASGINLGGTDIVAFSGGSLSGGSCGEGGHVDTWTVDGAGLVATLTCSAPTWPAEIASLRALVADLQARLAALEGARR
jgi:hypothetical protein